jgi:hypothetical protein
VVEIRANATVHGDDYGSLSRHVARFEPTGPRSRAAKGDLVSEIRWGAACIGVSLPHGWHRLRPQGAREHRGFGGRLRIHLGCGLPSRLWVLRTSQFLSGQRSDSPSENLYFCAGKVSHSWNREARKMLVMDVFGLANGRARRYDGSYRCGWPGDGGSRFERESLSIGRRCR